MEFLGIGPLELLFIVLIVVLIFSPKDIAGGAKTIGRTLNRMYQSDNYKILQKTSDEIRNLPQRLAREANLEDFNAELKAESPPAAPPDSPATPQAPFQAWTTPPPNEKRIAPPPPPPPDEPASGAV